jgi:hypothetical protein
MREIVRRAGVLAAGLVLVTGGTAAAATLKASYGLQDSRASQVAGAPDLVDLGSGNRFETETVDGAARPVLAFPRGGGLSLATSGLVDAVGHSIVMNVRLSDISGFRRLIDFSDGASDDGLYDLDGHIVLYVDGGVAVSQDAVLDGSWVQVALTSEPALAGSQWTVAAVNGTPIAAGTTLRGFRLGVGGLRLFKDNVRGPGRGEESGGAIACLRVYDGALTTAELGQVAADPLCPAPRPVSAGQLGYQPGTYVGRTSQGLQISFRVTATTVQDVSFDWRARCADRRVHKNGIYLGGTSLRHGRFSVFGVLGTGGRARVSGRIAGDRARGRLSRWAGSAFGTTCVARGVRWHAHLTHGGGRFLT